MNRSISTASANPMRMPARNPTNASRNVNSDASTRYCQSGTGSPVRCGSPNRRRMSMNGGSVVSSVGTGSALEVPGQTPPVAVPMAL